MFNVYIRRNSEMAESAAHKDQAPVDSQTAVSIKAPETACADCAEIASLGSDCYSVMFTPAVIEDPSRAMKLLSLIREFCDGGSQVYINCANSACLRKA